MTIYNTLYVKGLTGGRYTGSTDVRKIMTKARRNKYHPNSIKKIKY